MTEAVMTDDVRALIVEARSFRSGCTSGYLELRLADALEALLGEES